MRGRVVSDKMNKTVTVLVERRVKHPLYGKIVIQSRKFHAHDENNECKTGDLVEISATRKLAKTKAWRVSTGPGTGAGGLTAASASGKGRVSSRLAWSSIAEAGKTCHNFRFRPLRIAQLKASHAVHPQGIATACAQCGIQNWPPPRFRDTGSSRLRRPTGFEADGGLSWRAEQ